MSGRGEEAYDFRATLSTRGPFNTGLLGEVSQGIVRIYDRYNWPICEVWASQSVADAIAEAMNAATWPHHAQADNDNVEGATGDE